MEVYGLLFGWNLILDSGALIAIMAVAFLPKMFGLKFINGLFVFQHTLIFNIIVMFVGFNASQLPYELLAHFILVEFGFYILVLLLYRQSLPQLEFISDHLAALAARYKGAFVILFVLLVMFRLSVVAEDGSRISYMTASWFSVVKPIISLLDPLSFWISFSLLLNPYTRRVGLVLLGLALTANIFTGSKASFVYGFLTVALFYRDVNFYKRYSITATSLMKRFFFPAIIIFTTALFVLQSRVSGFFELWVRFFRYGEANILTYFSSSPTQACEGLSLFAKLHRGLARLLGDHGANDIDTLFGYALNILETGSNSFTGPNARISAYFLCNFSGISILAALCFLIWYAISFRVLIRCCTYSKLGVFVFPYAIFALNNSGQDFNLIMRDALYFPLISMLLYMLGLAGRGRKATYV